MAVENAVTAKRSVGPAQSGGPRMDSVPTIQEPARNVTKQAETVKLQICTLFIKVIFPYTLLRLDWTSYCFDLKVYILFLLRGELWRKMFLDLL